MSKLFKQVKNNAKSTTSGLNNTTDPVTFSVGAGEGARFPAIAAATPNSFWVTVWDSVTYGDPGDDPNMEILLVTTRSTDSLTAARGQLSTANVSHTGTVAVRVLVVDQESKDIHDAVNSLETLAVLGV